MKLKHAEFEEAEYRGPLFNQLDSSNLVWEPGQVFEHHIGIDRALWTANAYLLALHGHTATLAGVALSRYDLDYIWQSRNRRKKLPSFRLNLFVQAKRPLYGRYAPKTLKEHGLKSPYWRFEVTPHQQLALERLHTILKGRAIVCYACPAFHKEALLHKWTVEPLMVEHSTFPDVSQLNGHEAWNFSEPGTIGVANTEPVQHAAPPLLQRLQEFVERSEVRDSNLIEQLQYLRNAVSTTVNSDSTEYSFQRARFAEGVREIDRIADEFELHDNRSEFVAFATVRLFTTLYKVNWLVVGHGG
jgi:hypothetical protein